METQKMIEAYLDGSMLPEEKRQFEKKLAQDPSLADEVLFHQQIDQAIREDYISEYRVFIRNYFDKKRKKHLFGNMKHILTKRLPVAATLIFLLGISIYQLLLKTDVSDLSKKYNTPYITDVFTRSTEQSSEGVQIAYILYQEGDYATSSEILTNYLSENYEDITAHFYQALNAKALGLLEEAIDEFQLVEEDVTTPFALHARWYLALTLIDQGNYKEAVKYLNQLIDDETMYAKQAKKLKRAVRI